MIANAPEYAFCLQTLDLIKKSDTYSTILMKAQRLRKQLEKPFGGATNPGGAAMCPLGHFSVLTSQGRALAMQTHTGIHGAMLGKTSESTYKCFARENGRSQEGPRRIPIRHEN